MIEVREVPEIISALIDLDQRYRTSQDPKWLHCIVTLRWVLKLDVDSMMINNKPKIEPYTKGLQ